MSRIMTLESLILKERILLDIVIQISEYGKAGCPRVVGWGRPRRSRIAVRLCRVDIVYN
jgi:hypothetical protein